MLREETEATRYSVAFIVFKHRKQEYMLFTDTREAVQNNSKNPDTCAKLDQIFALQLNCVTWTSYLTLFILFFKVENGDNYPPYRLLWRKYTKSTLTMPGCLCELLQSLETENSKIMPKHDDMIYTKFRIVVTSGKVNKKHD